MGALSLVDLEAAAPCAHPRCARADEGQCVVAPLAGLLDGEATLSGAEAVDVDDDGFNVFVRALFRDKAKAYAFRDNAAPLIITAGLDFLSPGITTDGAVWEVRIILADRIEVAS